MYAANRSTSGRKRTSSMLVLLRASNGSMLTLERCHFAILIYSSRIMRSRNMTAQARKRNAFAAAAALLAASLVLGGCRSDRVERREPDIQFESKLRQMTLREPDDGLCHEAGPRKSLGPNEIRTYILCPGVYSQMLKEVLEHGRALAAKETLARGYTHFRLVLESLSRPGSVSIIPFMHMEYPAPPEGKVGFVIKFVMYPERDQATDPLYDATCLWNSGGCLYDARKILPVGAK
jgi:hypothetical protein